MYLESKNIPSVTVAWQKPGAVVRNTQGRSLAGAEERSDKKLRGLFAISAAISDLHQCKQGQRRGPSQSCRHCSNVSVVLLLFCFLYR